MTSYFGGRCCNRILVFLEARHFEKTGRRPADTRRGAEDDPDCVLQGAKCAGVRRRSASTRLRL